MSRLIDSDPAPFYQTNTAEQNSVIKLLDMFDKTVIKGELDLLDKRPNTDGYITVTDINQIPKGKLEVQVKTLPDSKVSRPTHQCDKPFLSHCEQSQLPVILIVVNAAKEIAYWHHISRAVIAELAPKIKKNSIAVHIPKTQVISRTDKGYIAAWLTIIDREKKRIIEFDQFKARITELEQLTSSLKSFPKPVHSIEAEHVRALQLFLDTLNNALDREYNSVKESYYASCYKLGIAFAIFTVNELAYAIYPVKFGENDLLLREVKHLRELILNDILNSRHFFHNNPILEDPASHAYRLISKDTLDLIEKRHIKMVTPELAIEYLFDFADYTDLFFNILTAPLDLQELSIFFNEFLPLWYLEYLKFNKIPISKSDYLIDLSEMSFRVPFEVRKAILANTHKLFDLGLRSPITLRYTHGEIDVNYAVNCVANLLDHGFTKLVRPYPKWSKGHKTGLIYDRYKMDSAYQKIKFVFNSLPIAFSDFIDLFFPYLKEKISFWDGASLMLVNFEYPTDKIDIYNAPLIRILNFEATTDYNGPRLITYLNGEGFPYEFDFNRDYFDTGIDLNGTHFKLRSGRWFGTTELYDRFTLQNYLYQELLSRFKDHFETLVNNE